MKPYDYRFLNLYLIFIFLCNILSCESSIIKYDNEPIVDFPFYLKYIGMFSSVDWKGPKTYVSKITYNITAKGENGKEFYIIVGARDVLINQFTCIGKTLEIIGPTNKDLYKIRNVKIEDKVANVSEDFIIKQRGLYSAFLASCDYVNEAFKVANYIQASGTIQFINPYGFLPGHKYLLMKFYYVMSYILATLLCIWVSYCVYYKKYILYHHYCIFFLTFITLIEMFLHSIELHSHNLYGIQSSFKFIIAELFSIMRKDLSRVTLLFISAGVGVLVFKLQSKTKKTIITTAIVYFFTSVVFELYKNSNDSPEMDAISGLLNAMLSIIDTFIYVWIFTLIYKNLNTISPQEKYKLNIYYKILICLFVSCVSNIIFTLFQIEYVRSKQWRLFKWWNRYWFMYVGYWDICFTILLIFSMYIWRPSESSYLALHSEQIPGEDENMEKAGADHKYEINIDSDDIKDLELGLNEKEELLASSSSSYEKNGKDEDKEVNSITDDKQDRINKDETKIDLNINKSNKEVLIETSTKKENIKNNDQRENESKEVISNETDSKSLNISNNDQKEKESKKVISNETDSKSLKVPNNDPKKIESKKDSSNEIDGKTVKVSNEKKI